MMIGAYTYAILTIPVESRAAVYQYFDGGIVQFCLPMIVALILAGVVPMIFAWLIGLPVLKLKSDYLAIATLGFAEIMRAIIQWKQVGPLTNASNLLKKFANFDSVLFPFIISAICIGIIVLIINSTYGRAFKAIRDDEIAAEAMGINLAKHKMQAFLISSFFAGVGGALLAMFQSSVQANTFTSTMTYEILLIVVIGGIGSVTGSILGSFLYIACSEWWLRFLDDPMPYIGVSVPFMRGGFRMLVDVYKRQKVQSFTVSDSRLTATLKDQTTVTCPIRDFTLFYDDLDVYKRQPPRQRGVRAAAGELHPRGGHRPSPPGQQLHRQDDPELSRALRQLRQ